MKKRTIILLCLLFCLFVLPQAGYTQTTTETAESITIPIATWNDLKKDWTILDSELMAYKSEMQKIKKPSNELLLQLSEAEKTLKLLKEELQKQNNDLILLSKQAEESKTELQILKQRIEKERKIHKRQVWQNRIWSILIGAGIGYAAHQ